MKQEEWALGSLVNRAMAVHRRNIMVDREGQPLCATCETTWPCSAYYRAFMLSQNMSLDDDGTMVQLTNDEKKRNEVTKLYQHAGDVGGLTTCTKFWLLLEIVARTG